MKRKVLLFILCVLAALMLAAGLGYHEHPEAEAEAEEIRNDYYYEYVRDVYILRRRAE